MIERREPDLYVVCNMLSVCYPCNTRGCIYVFRSMYGVRILFFCGSESCMKRVGPRVVSDNRRERSEGFNFGEFGPSNSDPKRLYAYDRSKRRKLETRKLDLLVFANRAMSRCHNRVLPFPRRRL